jgi:20S proteasome subunit beta 6
MASAGFKADAKTLQKMLHTRQVMYQHNHNKVMSCPAMAQLLSNTLYYKRFFPYYTFNLLGGLDNEGASRHGCRRTPSCCSFPSCKTHAISCVLAARRTPLCWWRRLGCCLVLTGKGCVYTYDAIGSYERTGYSCQGSGQALIMPVLDNQLKAISPLVLPLTVRPNAPF